MRPQTNNNVSYINHTNSSAPKWNNSSASIDSFSTIIRNRKILIIKEDTKFAFTYKERV